MNKNKEVTDLLNNIITKINEIKPINPDILKKKNVDIFDLMMPIAESADMGWYFKQLQDECKSHREQKKEQKSSKGFMLDILNNNIPKSSELLIVNARTGKDRRAFYTWAEEKGFRCCPAKITMFESTYIYECYECGESHYDEEMRYENDWSSINPGVCYGVFVRCPNGCDTLFDSSSEDDEYNDIKKREVFNAVIIGEILPLIPKKDTKRKKYIGHEKVDKELIHTIPKRDFQVINFNEFSKYTIKRENYNRQCDNNSVYRRY